jgi:pimeloyl-ACP methyl ester carboxylesterase
MHSAIRQRLRLSGGAELSFITAGDASKPAVLLLHGFPGSAGYFREVVPELSQAAYLIAPDLPGFGQSDVLPAPSFAAFGQAISELLERSRSGRATFTFTISARRQGFTSPCRRRKKSWASSFRTATPIKPGSGRHGSR